MFSKEIKIYIVLGFKSIGFFTYLLQVRCAVHDVIYFTCMKLSICLNKNDLIGFVTDNQTNQK